eukprot:IDg10944t1
MCLYECNNGSPLLITKAPLQQFEHICRRPARECGRNRCNASNTTEDVSASTPTALVACFPTARELKVAWERQQQRLMRSWTPESFYSFDCLVCPRVTYLREANFATHLKYRHYHNSAYHLALKSCYYCLRSIPIIHQSEGTQHVRSLGHRAIFRSRSNRS